MTTGATILAWALAMACGPTSFVDDLAPDGLEAYDTAPAPPSDPALAVVRRALPAWGLSTSEHDPQIAAFLEVHARSWRFWERIYAVLPAYRAVAADLRAAQLPELLAAVPDQASRFRPGPDPDCGAGPWRLPVSAPLRVAGCHLRGDPRPWSSGDPRPVVEGGACRIERCDVDERTDLAAATAAVLPALAATHRAVDGDPRRTLAAHARGDPDAAIAQHLLAACAARQVDPGAFPAIDLGYCDDLAVPSRRQVTSALAR
ncbi:MAG: hypothetical protein R3F59_09155 [Myxococcota bacterium]